MRTIAIFSLPVTILGACNDAGLSVHNAAPVVSIAAPFDGAVIAAEVPLTVQARLSDDLTPRDALSVQWASDLDGPLTGNSSLGDETTALDVGFGLSPGTHALSVTVFDAKGRSTTDTVVVEAVPNAPPRLQIQSPDTGSQFVPGAAFSLVATVEDDFDAPSALTYLLRSSTAGPLDIETVVQGSVVDVQVPAGLTLEDQTLTLEAFDGGGESGEASLEVAPLRNAPPTVTMLEPFADVVYTAADVRVSIEVDDPDAYELSELRLDWSGIVDHPAIELLEPLPSHPEADGSLSRYLAIDCDEMPEWGQPATFVIGVVVTDLDGAQASAQSEFLLLCHDG